MAESTNFLCKTCGARLDELAAASENGLVKCPYCHNVWTVPRRGADPAALSFLRMGEHDLDTCKFDDAYTAYKKAAELDGNEPEAYFGMALASFKVQYLKDEVNNRLQPICHEISEKVFSDDKNFRKALELATDDQRREYRKRGREIDEIKEEFYDLQRKGLDYDCFLCVKVKDDEKSLPDHIVRTADYERANDIYYYLKDEGYKPFFSEREIKGHEGTNYEALILYALYKSECMLIVCSNEEYLQTKWVKNEYTRFLRMLANDEKERDALTFAFYGTPVEKLPNGKKVQGIDLSKPDAYPRIEDFVQKHTPAAKKRREEEAAKKRAEEEARNRELEEMRAMLDEIKRSRAAAPQQPAARMPSEEEERRNRELEELKKQLAQMKQERATTAAPAKLSPAQLLAMKRKEEEEEEEAARIYDELTRFAEEGLKGLKSDAQEEARLAEERRAREEEERKKREEEARKRREEEERLAAERRAREEEERKKREEEERKRREEEERRAYLAQFEIQDGVLTKYKGKGGKVVIPDGVTSIGEDAFYCHWLSDITIPDSVTSIKRGAFGGTAYYNDESHWENGEVLYIGNHLVDVKRDTISGAYSIRKGTKTIVKSAFFECKGLTSIEIPDGVVSIEENTFYRCSELTSVTIGSGVTSIGDNAFEDCSELRSVNIPDSVTSIGDFAFCGCNSLKNIVIPEGVTEIGWCAFEGCSGLTSIAIPSSVTSIKGGFFECSGLKSITVAEGNKVYRSEGNCLIERETNTLIAGCNNSKIPFGVISIGTQAFSNCSGLTSITIPEGVKEIGWESFEGCSGLKSIDIPHSVTLIDEAAFNGCSGLTDITIPDSVTNIEFGAFEDCSGLASITIPDGVTVIESGVFRGCRGLTSIFLPAGVTSIGEVAFEGCSGLTSIALPEGVQSIGKGAFQGCSGLTNISLPAGITSISEGMFEGCSGLMSIALPEGVQLIEKCAFRNCSGLTSISLPAGITAVSEGMFEGCKGLKSFALPEGVTSIGNGAFEDCDGLKSAEIPESLTGIGNDIFKNCCNLESVIWRAENCADPDKPESIFEGCVKLANLTIGENVQAIPADLFLHCNGLKNVTIPKRFKGGLMNTGLKEIFGDNYKNIKFKFI